MELNLETSNQPALASAAVVMLRDGVPGLEVFLIKRHGLSDVLGGAYVFPGGKVDPSDAQVAQDLLDATGAELRLALAEPELADESVAALFFAALRELFEETGVLLAHGAVGPASDHEPGAPVAACRRRQRDGRGAFAHTPAGSSRAVRARGRAHHLLSGGRAALCARTRAARADAAALARRAIRA